MQNTVITALRCFSSLTRKLKDSFSLSPEDVVNRHGIFLKQIIASSSAITEWRFLQIVTELVELHLRVPSIDIQPLLDGVIEGTATHHSLSSLREIIKQNITPDYLKSLRKCMEKKCGIRKRPQCELEALIKQVTTKKISSEEVNWPTKSDFFIHQRWYSSETFCAIFFSDIETGICKKAPILKPKGNISNSKKNQQQQQQQHQQKQQKQ